MNEKRPRQRIPVACKGCRVKRTKCDGNPTQCSACRQRDQPCEYSPSENNRKPPSKTYVRALEERVHVLEEELAALRGGSSCRSSNPSQASAPSSTPMAGASDLNMDSLTDTLGSFNIGDGGILCYFGSCSNFHLLRRELTHKKPSSQELQLQAYHCHAAYEPTGLNSVSSELQAHLLDLFWTWQNSWQHIVARDPFLRDLAINPASPTGKFYSPSLLCAIYALASRYSDLPELRAGSGDQSTAGDVFAFQAKRMLIHEWEAPSTATIQATALLSIREVAVDKEALGWNYCGVAVRMALSLGLHLDCSHCVEHGEMTAEEAEVRSVTWWGCWHLDRLWNIGLGRPSMIRVGDVTAKFPSLDCEEEVLICPASRVAAQKASPPLPSHIVTNFVASCRLFLDTAKVLDTIYSPSSKDGQAELVSSAHLRLTEFYKNLPNCLKVSRSSQDISPPHVYQLHLQFYTIMILIHRPFLQFFRKADSTLAGLASNSIHVSACQTSAGWIATILRSYKGHYGLRTIPVSAVHCAFTAAVIFLATATSSDMQVRKKAMLGLRCVFQSLKDMETPWSWSRRSILAIGSIARAWKVDLSQFNPEPQEESSPLGHGSASNAAPATETAPACPEIALEEAFLIDGLYAPPMDFPQDAMLPSLDWSSLDQFEHPESFTKDWEELYWRD